MSDDIDRAQNEVERSLGEALRQRKPVGPLPRGFCLYCDEPVEGQQRWCDAEHRNQWERTHVRG